MAQEPLRSKWTCVAVRELDADNRREALCRAVDGLPPADRRRGATRQDLSACIYPRMPVHIALACGLKSNVSRRDADMSVSRDLELKSSAVTLSDMELFIFPELMYSLVLANIMSPRLWRWREDPWFAEKKRTKNAYRRITRLKQYIMDHYQFNLDLDTWGLTTKERELARFADFISPDILSQSNALFGYEGDKYYFDIDIRTHFGLDKYGGNIIPYWKTETVEAMDAFRHRKGYEGIGAGECVSLSTLYAAALFIVAGIPLRDLYLMATPLHSQNFIDVRDGILTNNRRLVTKNMWFNGTALSAQARRALENERVTVVAHESGCIHVVYDEATIDAAAYARFSRALREYLATPLTDEILGNYLRHTRDIQKCFQLRWPVRNVVHYAAVEHLFAYEHGSSFSLTDHTRDKLLADVDRELFHPSPLPGRIVLNDLEAFVREQKIDLKRPADVCRLKSQFASNCLNAEIAIEMMCAFCRVHPRLPDAGAKRLRAEPEALGLSTEMSREEVMDRLESIRPRNATADLAFYAYRDLNRTEAEPFLLAAVQRNPVCLEGVRGMDDEECLARLEEMPDESIYDEAGRTAQPDEVWNYGRGDGLEKSVLLACILRNRKTAAEMALDVEPQHACLRVDGKTYAFASSKGIREQRWTIPPVSV